jgi:hypothetical protein
MSFYHSSRVVWFFSVAWASEGSTDFDLFPASGKVTRIDLGSNSCIFCKRMTPILEKLKDLTGG